MRRSMQKRHEPTAGRRRARVYLARVRVPRARIPITRPPSQIGLRKANLLVQACGIVWIVDPTRPIRKQRRSLPKLAIHGAVPCRSAGDQLRPLRRRITNRGFRPLCRVLPARSRGTRVVRAAPARRTARQARRSGLRSTCKARSSAVFRGGDLAIGCGPGTRASRGSTRAARARVRARVQVSDAVPKSCFSVRSSAGHSMRSAFAKRR
jgi:hypothetical protein